MHCTNSGLHSELPFSDTVAIVEEEKKYKAKHLLLVFAWGIIFVWIFLNWKLGTTIVLFI